MSEVFGNLALGFSVAFSLNNLLYCLIGVSLGTFIGVLPGVGPLVTIAVLLPLTFGMQPETALIMLAGIYYGAAYGGSTTAILVNLPGEASSAVTCIDGNQMARQGRAGPALAIAAMSSLFAGCVGTVLIVVLGPPLTELALQFGAPDYFSLTLMALVASAALVHGSLMKGVAMAMVGILFGVVGTDVNSGVARFTFGVQAVQEGINFAVVAIGLFAIADIVHQANATQARGALTSKVTELMPKLADLRASWKAMVRGTAVGSMFGILPGVGQTVSSFAAYMLEKRVSADPSRFGHGAIEGVAAPEAANNAAAQTSFIPTLTLGIPGSATMALLLGALMIQGVPPGPAIMTQHPQIFWGLIASMWIGNVILVILNLPLVGLWVKMLQVPYRWLFPAILMFSCVGVYTVNFNVADIGLVALFGVLGYLFLKLGCEPAPFVLGFVLGQMMEENFRRSLLLSRGDFAIFLSKPLSAIFLAVSLILVVMLLMPAIRRTKEIAVPQEPS